MRIFLVCSLVLSSVVLAQEVKSSSDKTKLTVTFQPAPNRGERIYKTYCHHCHGERGDGTGHMGAGLPTKPVDLTDPALASQLTEDKVFKLVRDGSAKQGGSIFMIAWKIVLRDEEIRDVAAYTVELAAAGRAKRAVEAAAARGDGYRPAPMIPRVVIVGGGFAGLYAARRFSRGNVKVTLVDRQNYHLFQPLLYQVATAGLSPGDIATPIRSLVAAQSNVEVRMGEVVGVELSQRRVLLADGALDYDFLILAAGVRHSYFGRDDWEPFAPGLKTLDDALELRRRVLTAFEAAEKEDDPARRRANLTFVVVGGGPTGVELAGAIAELSRFTVARDYRRFDPRTSRVVLVEAGDRVLSAFTPELSTRALESLQRLGVEVRLSTRVTQVDAAGVNLGAERIAAHTVLWAAGVAAAPLTKTLGVELDRAGRVKVNSDLSIPGFSTAYVVGDLACVTQADGSTVPGLAPAAIQQGEHAADNVMAASLGHPTEPFSYVDKGIMATVGRASGIAQSGPLRLSGFIGWCAWLFIHILYLIGFRNRLVVLIQWAWAWFTYGRSARLITGTSPVPGPPARAPVAEEVRR